MAPITKPDYLFALEKRILSWAMAILGTLIVGFVGITITFIINVNRLMVQFEDHVKANTERFSGIDQRVSNIEQRATGSDKRSSTIEQRAIDDRKIKN